MATNPRIFESLEDDLRHAIKVWKKQDSLLNGIDEEDTYYNQKEKERLARGIVRGLAQAVLFIGRPYEHNDKDAIAHVERQYGLKGDKPSNPRAPQRRE